MNFKIIGNIQQEETFATGSGIREITRLRRTYGRGGWRKRKGIVEVEFENGITKLVSGVTPLRSHRQWAKGIRNQAFIGLNRYAAKICYLH